MGTATSKNETNLTTKALTKVATNIVNNTDATSNQQQIITISGTEGDVDIHGVDFEQNATINVSSLLKAMSTSTAQQDVSQDLSQSAKSLLSGINLGQFSDASNEMNVYLQATVDIATNIDQYCKSTIQQDQKIEVKNTKGSVTIDDISMKQLSNVFSNCIEDAVASSSAIQSVSQTLKQDASATSKGVSEWALVLMALIGLLLVAAPVAVPLIFGSSAAIKIIMAILFPMLLFAGIFMIVWYYTSIETYMDGYGFSRLISVVGNKCSGKSYKTVTNISSAGKASDACKNDDKCVAVDWQGMNITANNDAEILENPKTTFYSSVDSDCVDAINDKKDSVNLMGVPNVQVSNTKDKDMEKWKKSFGYENKPIKTGDIWIDVSDTKNPKIRKFSSYINDFDTKSTLLGIDNSDNKTIVFQPPDNDDLPSSSSDKNAIIIKFKGDSGFFNSYIWGKGSATDSKDAWQLTPLTVPGKSANTPVKIDANGIESDVINSTSFKNRKRKYGSWMLWVGVAMTVLGLGGTIYNFTQPSSKPKPK